MRKIPTSGRDVFIRLKTNANLRARFLGESSDRMALSRRSEKLL